MNVLSFIWNYSIYTATWNVNGRPCADISLNAWLANSDEAPDIYAISFQELDLSPKAITFSESRPDPIWMYVLSSVKTDDVRTNGSKNE